MKREANKIAEKLRESEKKHELVKPTVPKDLISAPPPPPALRAELNWRPRQLEVVFSGAYRRYRIDGMPGTDSDTFFSRVRRFLIDLLERNQEQEP